jgi:hypothetical protein
LTVIATIWNVIEINIDFVWKTRATIAVVWNAIVIGIILRAANAVVASISATIAYFFIFISF